MLWTQLCHFKDVQNSVNLEKLRLEQALPLAHPDAPMLALVGVLSASCLGSNQTASSLARCGGISLSLSTEMSWWLRLGALCGATLQSLGEGGGVKITNAAKKSNC